METTEIKQRIIEISERLVEISREQSASGLELARAQGTDKVLGVHVDPLTKWARRMRELNTESQELAEERRRLRAEKREQRVCDCACH
jgi:hypothetical protein